MFNFTFTKVLPKTNRLTYKKDFETVFKKGESVKNGFLIVKRLKNNIPESRFGFVVSKKISPKATIRNKVKRRLRNAVLLQLDNTKRGMDVIVITLPGIEKKEFSEIKEMIRDTFKKIKLV